MPSTLLSSEPSSVPSSAPSSPALDSQAVTPSTVRPINGVALNLMRYRCVVLVESQPSELDARTDRDDHSGEGKSLARQQLAAGAADVEDRALQRKHALEP